jgi:mRNA interferase RelE/StbE
MTVIVKPNADLVVPRSVRRRAGIKAGDRLEFRVSGGAINIVRKSLTADGEYTPRQRRIVDRALAEGLDDIRKGRLHGPFVRKAFDKQAKLLLENLHHPSLRAKKYDETKDIWQARVNRSWRFYFMIDDDTYIITRLIPHPK